MRKQVIAVLTAATIALTGCATAQYTDETNDPLESYNRTMYDINKAVDNVIIKPSAKVYNTVIPMPISWGISNFFNNLSQVTVILNDLLQLKFDQALSDMGRFALNSTVGVAGIFDVAGHAGYKNNKEDFGQTLGYWGVEPGPYLVLPFFGPRNFRDSFGLIGDTFTNPVTYLDNPATRNGFFIANTIDKRANLLGADNILDEATFDEYAYVRDAYNQRRRNLVYDGNPPEEEDFDIFDD